MISNLHVVVLYAWHSLGLGSSHLFCRVMYIVNCRSLSYARPLSCFVFNNEKNWLQCCQQLSLPVLVGGYGGWYSPQGSMINLAFFFSLMHFPSYQVAQWQVSIVGIVYYFLPSHEYSLTKKVILPTQDASFNVLNQVARPLSYFFLEPSLRKVASYQLSKPTYSKDSLVSMMLFSNLQNKTNTYMGNSFPLSPGKIKKASQLGLKRKNIPAFFFCFCFFQIWLLSKHRECK